MCVSKKNLNQQEKNYLKGKGCQKLLTKWQRFDSLKDQL